GCRPPAVLRQRASGQHPRARPRAGRRDQRRDLAARAPGRDDGPGRARPRLEPSRRGPALVPRTRAVVPARAGAGGRRCRRGSGPGGRAAPPGDGGADLGDRAHPHAHAGEDNVLLPEAAHRPGVPRGGRLTLRARLYDWECRHVAGRTLQDLEFYVRLAPATGGPVLELGCGTGRLTRPLAAMGFDVTGLDNDPEMLQWSAPGVTLVEGDMRDFDLATTFPLVMIPYNTLQLLPDDGARAQCFATVARHLAPDGLFALEVTDFLVGATA